MSPSRPITVEQFTRIYAVHYAEVHAVARAILRDDDLAADVAQDVFARFWRTPAMYRPERAGIGTLLRVMARSRAIDLWRARDALDRTSHRYASGSAPVAVVSLDQAVQDSDEHAKVRRAVAVLPEHQRRAVVLTYWGGLTAEELARHERIPLGTAKSRIRLGVRRLREDASCGMLGRADHLVPRAAPA